MIKLVLNDQLITIRSMLIKHEITSLWEAVALKNFEFIYKNISLTSVYLISKACDVNKG